MKLLITLCLFLLSESVSAYMKVESFVERRRILVTLDMDYQLYKGQRLMVLTQEKQELVAIGRIKEILISELPHRAVVDIEEILGSNQLLVGDGVELLTPEMIKRYHVPGHLSLILGDSENVSAKYKDLAYLGVFNSEGHTLAQREWLLSLATAQYGITDTTTLKVNQSLYLDGFANAGFKQRIIRNRFMHMTMNGLVSRQINRPDWVTQAGLIMTFPSNEKFQTHVVINANLEGIDEDNAEVKKLNLFPDSDVRTIYEYITDDWDRFLFGPSFNLETRTVGGTVSHMWIWDTFHLNLGLGTKDVSNVEFETSGYYVLFDFFWRF